MDNEVKEQVQNESAAQEAEVIPAQPETPTEQDEEIKQLRGELTELKLRLALLTGGAAPERLDEGMRLAAGLINSGEQPETAAETVLTEYPHIRLARRELPQLSAESRGCGDGFAAIRSIFSKR